MVTILVVLVVVMIVMMDMMTMVLIAIITSYDMLFDDIIITSSLDKTPGEKPQGYRVIAKTLTSYHCKPVPKTL